MCLVLAAFQLLLWGREAVRALPASHWLLLRVRFGRRRQLQFGGQEADRGQPRKLLLPSYSHPPHCLICSCSVCFHRIVPKTTFPLARCWYRGYPVLRIVFLSTTWGCREEGRPNASSTCILWCDSEDELLGAPECPHSEESWTLVLCVSSPTHCHRLGKKSLGR